MNPNQIVVSITRAVLLVTLTLVTNLAFGDAVIVDCDAGQSLNRSLSRLDKRTPTVVRVKGTCTEYVEVKGFDDLTLKGAIGAKLVQPVTPPASNLLSAVLLIGASRRVTIDGLKVIAPTFGVPGIAIGQASSDIRLRNLTLEGGLFGIMVFEHSQISLARVAAHDAGYSPLGVYDKADVHVEDCLFETSATDGWHVGIDAAGHVTMHATTIRNMQVGMQIGLNGAIDIGDFNSYYPAGGPTDVIIDNPAGTNFFGVSIEGGSLNLGAALRITNAAQPGGGQSAAIRVMFGGNLNEGYPGNKLIISGSRGHGVYVGNGSSAHLAGSRITGSLHGGITAVNFSTVSVDLFLPAIEVGGNAVDLFCDSHSVITGGVNIINATNVQCANLLAGDSEPLP